jgi:hypothetical protein
VAEKRHIAEVGAVALYGLIEELVRSWPAGRPEVPAPSGPGVATKHDALTAVAQLARAIETPAQDGDLDPEYAHRMASLLLVIRDFIEPLSPDTDQHVTRYLREFVGKCTGSDGAEDPQEDPAPATSRSPPRLPLGHIDLSTAAHPLLARQVDGLLLPDGPQQGPILGIPASPPPQ